MEFHSSKRSSSGMDLTECAFKVCSMRDTISWWDLFQTVQYNGPDGPVKDPAMNMQEDDRITEKQVSKNSF